MFSRGVVVTCLEISFLEPALTVFAELGLGSLSDSVNLRKPADPAASVGVAGLRPRGPNAPEPVPANGFALLMLAESGARTPGITAVAGDALTALELEQAPVDQALSGRLMPGLAPDAARAMWQSPGKNLPASGMNAPVTPGPDASTATRARATASLPGLELSTIEAGSIDAGAETARSLRAANPVPQMPSSAADAAAIARAQSLDPMAHADAASKREAERPARIIETAESRILKPESQAVDSARIAAAAADARRLDFFRQRFESQPASHRVQDADVASLEAARQVQADPSLPTTVKAGVMPTLSGPRPDTVSIDQAIGQRLAWMIQHGKQDARIQVKPESLGSIDISLKVDGDDARLSVSSPHGVVRDALELALPRLRELMSSAGLTLAQFDVGTGDPRSAESSEGQTAGSDSDAHPAAEVSEAPESPTSVEIPRSLGLVDTFA